LEVNQELISLLSSTTLTRRDKLIAILFSDGNSPKETSDIKRIGINAGLREIEKWNISDTLGKSKGCVTKLKQGWILTKEGFAYAEQSIYENPSSTKSIAKGLRPLLPSIKNIESRTFIEEAIKCLEVDAFKAAIVFSWVGAISILYDYVVTNKLTEFNAEAKRRDAKWKNAVTRDDLALMKESDFLDILASLSILGKNVKEHLKTNLNDRNSCGHPSSVVMGKHNVESHIEFLINNVYKKY
jgi:hypothetical protein